MSYKLAAIAHQLALSLVIISSIDRKQEQTVEIKKTNIDATPKPRIIPNDYAGNSWRRQGKRKGHRR